MKKISLLDDYLSKYAAGPLWQLQAGDLHHIAQIVVIPAYAEKDHLFETLASLAANDDDALEKTLVICVVNNKMSAPDADKDNNRQTLECLKALIGKRHATRIRPDGNIPEGMKSIADRPLRLGVVDASSPGREIPIQAGGVGMARKIGMDSALALLRHAECAPRIILSLDADTLVQTKYLSTVRNVFSSGKTHAAVIAYEHQMPREPVEQEAIISYEIFLRYWVLGLKFAGSPYAYHSIGSTIVTTDDAYLAVRGMNRREAGEDFYFLNKLAKTVSIRRIRETVVYPSARISRRVPFGTGAAVGKIIGSDRTKMDFYDPEVFRILKKWIALMNEHSFKESEQQILSLAKTIDPGLESFLSSRDFPGVWKNIRRNVKDEKTCIRQFHSWFDGFETLKLLNDLTRKYYPKINLLAAVGKMFDVLGWEYPEQWNEKEDMNRQSMLNILAFLRERT